MLTAAKLKELDSPGTYRAGPNLYLQVKRNGARSWLCRYQLNGRPRQMGLGAVRHVGLTEARDLAFDAAKLARSGRDPIELRRTERKAKMVLASGPTFNECATLYIEAHEAGWRSPKSSYQWTASLKTYAGPVIGKLAVAAVTVEHMVEILQPIWASKSETAGRVRARVEKVLGWATAKGYRKGDNPAAWSGALSHMLPALGRVQKVEHHPAVAHSDVPKLMKQLVAADTPVARALILVTLTATRSNEVRGARWAEVDFEAKLWTVPAERTKMAKRHRIPLSDAALTLLKKQKRGGGSQLIFEGEKAQKPLSDAALLKGIRRFAGDGYTVHGLRSSFRDWCAETGVAREVAESALAHAVGNKVEAAYLRSDLLDRRRLVMQDWAAHCEEVLK